MTECLFCKIQGKGYEDEIAYENEFFIATRDSYPVTKLHTLIIPKRHFASFFRYIFTSPLSTQYLSVLFCPSVYCSF